MVPAKIDLKIYEHLAAEGYISIREHPDAPLFIFNYTAKTQYDRLWRPETLRSRGLITSHEGIVIARPFEKFFNLDEHIGLFGQLPAEPFEVFEKMDGSLGILYHWEGKFRIATRGSFQSEQSEVANEILHRKYAHVAFDPRLTYLFEIIYPENRIVVDYGNTTDLILLGVRDTATGRELPLPDLGLPLVPHRPGLRSLDALRQLEEDNKEGYVVRFESGLRVKVKFDEYVRLHKILTSVTRRTVWQWMQENAPMDEVLAAVPDEFYAWIKSTQAELRAEFAAIEATVEREYRTFSSRKEAAAYFLGACTYPSLMFMRLDGRDLSPAIWPLIYPAHQTPFRNESP